MDTKHKFAFYLTPALREQIDGNYAADNCGSRTEFIEKAVQFYLGYLKNHAENPLLPAAISSAIDGKLGTFENRIASLLFKQTVELDMVMNILAADTEIDEGTLENLRGKCVDNVKRTNGRMSFRDALLYQRSV